MKKITLLQILKQLKTINFPEFDIIVAVGRDGIMPASLLHHFLKTPVKVIWINYRDKQNKPIRKSPKLTKPFPKIKNKRILLVDTISKTGKTLSKAKEILKDNKVSTFVINGKADYSLFHHKECIEWPWNQ